MALTRARAAASGAWYEFDAADPADGSSFTFNVRAPQRSAPQRLRSRSHASTRAAQEFVRRGTPGFSAAHPGSPPPLVHYAQCETFKVLRGVMGYVLDGRNGTVASGESVSIPPGLPHFFYNAGDAAGADLLVRITLRPAGAARRFFENLAGLSRDYGSIERVPPLQLLQLFDAGDVDLAAPRPAQWLLRRVAPHGRLRDVIVGHPRRANFGFRRRLLRLFRLRRRASLLRKPLLADRHAFWRVAHALGCRRRRRERRPGQRGGRRRRNCELRARNASGGQQRLEQRVVRRRIAQRQVLPNRRRALLRHLPPRAVRRAWRGADANSRACGHLKPGAGRVSARAAREARNDSRAQAHRALLAAVVGGEDVGLSCVRRKNEVRGHAALRLGAAEGEQHLGGAGRHCGSLGGQRASQSNADALSWRRVGARQVGPPALRATRRRSALRCSRGGCG